ncbi:MAG: ChaN family lipoprotein [Gemmatimonadetes bacterium]|nr:ChaN family lipoprotein [Gemmatimonadota bacterium]
MISSFSSLQRAQRAGIALSAILVTACASRGPAGAATTPLPTSRAGAQPTTPAASTGYRIVAPATLAELTLTQMVDRFARTDVVFFGEQHDDPETHRAEAEVLEAIGRIGRPVVLSLEMFERDVQPIVNDYVAGRVNEADFLARSRPWPRYATDYRRLVELAKERRWPVLAANVPRPLASAVGRKGLAALDTLTPAERLNAARDNICPQDDYRARFMESMRSHSPGTPATATAAATPEKVDSLPTAVAERFYLAQCVKDETMAESIVNARLAAPRNAIVVHFDGAFHSDYGQGTAARVKRRQPGWSTAVITAVPVADPAVAPIATRSGLADFVIFTRRPTRRP